MFTPTLVLVTLLAGADVVVIDSRGDGFRSESSVNGFSTAHMPSVESITGTTSGYPSWEHRCFPVHPYFLKPGTNTIVMTYTFDDSLVAREEKGPWRQTLEVMMSTLANDAEPVSLAKQAGPALTRAADKKEQKLSATFKLPVDPPAWGWTKSAAIADNKETAASLYAEYVKLWTTLQNLPKAAPAEREAFRTATRASTADFIRASESRGKPYKLVEDLTHAAATLGMPGDAPPEPATKGGKDKTKAPEPKPIKPPTLAPVTDTPSDTGPNLHPHLTWVPLPPANQTKLVVFAGGHLAKLVSTERNETFTFASNWTDGPWGARGTEKLSFEAWYRKNAAGAWELDALYPTYWSNIASLSVSSMVDGMAF